ncbi:Ldh family oxidoreductase [Glaciibacter psychrotolerans]|uniref:LDH2 family malate/lactate/ureidoglycolate dehydrogenase n=1 Tax=Glaciibacter psychrotolerans TaxID=670054 RepID=A0A7Z0EHE4_9MICO|nr:LDH2 family malate/lactate/ureidoglycolate dehydrogenase [Leifsonia psychrotolerans]
MSARDSRSVEQWAAAILSNAGLRGEAAQIVAANLSYAERRGVISHGFIRLATYLERIKAGGINSNPDVHLVEDSGAMAVMTADNGPGASSAVAAVEQAMERARKYGIGCVLVRDANHFGATGFYTDMMAEGGFVGIAACNTDAVMCAPFGGMPVLGTNPLSIALPLPAPARPQLDMATTEASYGKLVVAAQEGSSIPLGWAVDAQGQSTTNPQQGLEGALLPSGGPKGFGLAFMIDGILALSGAKTSPFVSALYGDASEPQHLGHLFIALNVPGERHPGAYAEQITSLVDAVHSSSPPLPGSPALTPGEPELERELGNGSVVTLSDEQLRVLNEIGSNYGEPFPGA